MKVIFTPIFNRRNKLNSHGKATIEVRAYHNRKRTFISTGIFILPIHWDERRQVINKKHPQANELNSQIDKIISDFEKKQLEYQVTQKSFSINSVKDLNVNVRNESFIEFAKKEIEKNQSLSVLTKRSHLNTLNNLQKFKNREEIYFSEIDYSFIDDFINYLRKEKYAINTIHKQHKNLRKYIELGIKKGFYSLSNPCKDIKVRQEYKKREVLTFDEIKKIEDLDVSHLDVRVKQAKDMFLFACYTGLRISDVTHLMTKYVKKEKQGYELEFITIKVNKRAEIPLHALFKVSGAWLSKPEAILENYYNEENDYVFPKISEAYINRNLKLIAKLAGIEIRLSFHTARHSFGTYMSTKIPLPQLLILMQHSDIQTTMIYVNTSQELVKQGLLKVDWE
jgi:integrase